MTESRKNKGFTLEKVVPWGRSYDEYVSMFNLSKGDLRKRILGCGDGPAAFNAELTVRGGSIVSVDPVYAFGVEQIRLRISETYETVMEQLRSNRDDYVWDTILSVEELGDIRMEAMELFLADYDAGKREGRYIEGELPTLPVAIKKYDLALSSHFLFLYSDHLSQESHVRALSEMLRVAAEVRVFPLLKLNAKESPYLAYVMAQFNDNNYESEIQTVSYEFQRGGNKMLVIKEKI